MTHFQVFIDGCVNGVTIAEDNKEAAIDYAKEKYPKIDGYYYTVRDDGTVVVQHVTDEKFEPKHIGPDFDPYAFRLMVIHAEPITDEIRWAA